jgi:ActR/RegA family two-component response regulator
MTINSDDDPEKANIKEMQDELKQSQQQPMSGFQQAEEHIEKVLKEDDQSTSA